jgi:hypothetical protein
VVRLIATVRVAINRVRCPVAKELHFLNNMPLATRALDGHPPASERGGRAPTVRMQ